MVKFSLCPVHSIRMNRIAEWTSRTINGKKIWRKRIITGCLICARNRDHIPGLLIRRAGKSRRKQQKKPTR